MEKGKGKEKGGRRINHPPGLSITAEKCSAFLGRRLLLQGTNFPHSRIFVKFQTVLLWCHKNVPLRSEPETKSSTFNKKGGTSGGGKTNNKSDNRIYTSLDELLRRLGGAEFSSFSNDASFETCKKVCETASALKNHVKVHERDVDARSNMAHFTQVF